eukprot:UN23697
MDDLFPLEVKAGWSGYPPSSEFINYESRIGYTTNLPETDPWVCIVKHVESITFAPSTTPVVGPTLSMPTKSPTVSIPTLDPTKNPNVATLEPTLSMPTKLPDCVNPNNGSNQNSKRSNTRTHFVHANKVTDCVNPNFGSNQNSKRISANRGTDNIDYYYNRGSNDGINKCSYPNDTNRNIGYGIYVAW